MPVTGSLDVSEFMRGPVSIYFDVPIPADNSFLALTAGVPASGLRAGLTVGGVKVECTYTPSSEEADELKNAINQIITAESFSIETELYQVPDNMELLKRITPHGKYFNFGGTDGFGFGGATTIPTVAQPSVLVVGPLTSFVGAFLGVQLFSAINVNGAVWDWTRRKSASIPVKLVGQPLPARSPGNQTGFIWRS